MNWQIIFTALGFLSTMYFARTLGASILGAYYLFLAYYGIVGTITNGGFGQAAVKRISEGEQPNEYFTTYFVIRTISTLIFLAMLVAFRPYFVDLDNSGMFIWLIIALIISIPTGVLASATAGTGKMGVRTSCAGIGDIAKILIQILAVYLGYETAGLAGGAVAGVLIAAIIEFRFFDLHIRTFNINHIKKLTSFSFWIFLTSGGILVFSQADTVFIGYYMSNTDVGIYRIAFQFTTVAAFAAYSLRTTLWPRISKWEKTKNREMIEASLSRAISFSLVLAIPVFVGGVLLGDKLLLSFYGEDFASGYTTLIILLTVQIVNVFQFFFTMYLDAMDRPKESFKVTLVGVVANIILNMVLIPLIGISGAALATFITMTINAVLAHKILSKQMKITIEKYTIFSIVKSSLLMAIIILIYRFVIPLDSIISVLLPVFIGASIYGYTIIKIDSTIHKEIEDIFSKIGIPWPKWI